MCKELTSACTADPKPNGGEVESTSPVSGSKKTEKTFDMHDVALSAHEDSVQRLIVVHDNVYDVAEYMEIHPGGYLVLRDMIGKDCTDAFDCYHRPKSCAFHIIKKYKVGTLMEPLEVPAHVQAFRKLREDLVREGAFEPQPWFYVQLYIFLVFLFVAAVYMSTCTASSPSETYYWHMCGAAVMGLFWQQLAGFGHDGGHSSVTNNFLSDHEFASKVGCFFGGISMGWWKRNHNTHHVVCNSIESDPNIQHLPLFSVAEKIMEKPYQSTYSGKVFSYDKIGKFLVSYQHYLFFPIMAVARFNLYAQSYTYLLKKQHGMTYYRNEELAALIGFAVWVLSIAFTMPTYLEGVQWILMSHAVAGILHVQIVLSHFSMEVYRDREVPDDKEEVAAGKEKGNDSLRLEEDDWYLLQLRTTLDVDCSPWIDWFHIGLQFQLAHHMYPTLPRNQLRATTKRVEAICKKHGLTYHSLSFWGGLQQTVQGLYETAMVARTGRHCNNEMLWDAVCLQG